MSEERCPCCSNHCLKDNLGCGRGAEYFNRDNDSNIKTLDEQVIMELRKCGHLLHHNKELNPEKLLSVFSEQELNQLHSLLSKIHD